MSPRGSRLMTATDTLTHVEPMPAIRDTCQYRQRTHSSREPDESAQLDDADGGAHRRAGLRRERAVAIVEATILAVRDVVEARSDDDARCRLLHDRVAALDHRA